MIALTILLFIWQATKVGANLATLGLVIEDANVFIMKTKEESRGSLVFEVKITQTVALQSLTILDTLVKDWKALPCFVDSSPLKESLFTTMDPGHNLLADLKSRYLHFYTYLGTGTITAGSTCILKREMFPGSLLVEGAKQLLSVRTGVSMTGSASEIFSKKDVLRAAADLALAYNALISDLYSEIDEMLTILNMLNENSFPQILRGDIDTLACLSLTGSNYEDIKVRGNKKEDSQLIFEIESLEPAVLTSYTKLRRIIYEDVRIRVLPNLILAKESNTNKYHLLICEDIEEKTPICSPSNEYLTCISALEQQDVDLAIRSCKFEYGSDSIAVRLQNEGILVQGEFLNVMQGTVALIQKPPLVIYSNSEIKVSNLIEEMVFKPTIQFLEQKVETSKITGLQLAAMKVRAYWHFIWSSIQSSEILNYISIIIEAIFAPLTLVGLCLGCRKRTVSQKENIRVVNRRSRKSNYRENMELLNTRGTRSSRR